MKLSFKLLGILALVMTLVKVKSERFTALSELEQMIETEGVILEKLNHYIRFQEERLNQLRWLALIRFWQKHHFIIQYVFTGEELKCIENTRKPARSLRNTCLTR